MALPSAIVLGAATQLGAIAFFAQPDASPSLAISAAVMWLFLAWWPLPNAMRRPGPLRAALIVMPVALVFSSRAWLPLSAALNAFVLFHWRFALTTVRLSPGRWVWQFIASAIGGAMYGVLLSPRLIDAMPSLEPIEAHEVSRFQRILVTRTATVTRLWLDGQQQLASDEERTYHEALVRPAMSAKPKRVLILGGGDVLAAREALLHDFVTSVTMVELDAKVIELVRTTSLAKLLGAHDPRLTIVIDDAIAWLRRQPAEARFDAIVVDFPDPTTPVIAGLFAKETWELVKAHLEPEGLVTIQSSSLEVPEVPAAIAMSLRAVGLKARVYAQQITSFGSQAFIVAGHSLPERFTLRAPATTLTDDAALNELLVESMVDGGFVITAATVERLAAQRVSSSSRPTLL
ncbi:MAG: hypothetical protein QM817_06685 [Archangium sp.]